MRRMLYGDNKTGGYPSPPAERQSMRLVIPALVALMLTCDGCSFQKAINIKDAFFKDTKWGGPMSIAFGREPKLGEEDNRLKFPPDPVEPIRAPATEASPWGRKQLDVETGASAYD